MHPTKKLPSAKGPWGEVPGFFEELTIKADLNGITILNEGRYRKRYTGSRKFSVDINGHLHTSSQLKKILLPTIEKRPPRKAVTAVPVSEDEPQPEKSYSINKPEIRQRIFAMISKQKKKELYFWTVTFPLKTDDKVIYKLFNTWLTTLRQKKWLKNYLWVAERQENGTLHFHLCIPHKLSVVAANRAMARILAGASERGEINYSKHQCRRYNGVDIAKNRKERKVTNFANGKRGRRALVTYITKYITKNNGSFTHLAWHNSRGFSELFTGITFTAAEFVEKFCLGKFVRRHSAIRNKYFSFWPWKDGPPPPLEGELILINQHIEQLQILN